MNNVEASKAEHWNAVRNLFLSYRHQLWPECQYPTTSGSLYLGRTPTRSGNLPNSSTWYWTWKMRLPTGQPLPILTVRWNWIMKPKPVPRP